MKKQGFEFRISQGLRTPQTQAQYYCQWNKRPPASIDADIAQCKQQGAPWIASLLATDRNIPRTPNWLTSQLPGSGWHQWGVAADCYCYVNGKQVPKGNAPCYKAYAEEAVKLGLTAGFYFKHQDAGHVQLPKESGARDIYKWDYIDKIMQERFGGKQSVALVGAAPAP
jgi:hypothetical protein